MSETFASCRNLTRRSSYSWALDLISSWLDDDLPGVERSDRTVKIVPRSLDLNNVPAHAALFLVLRPPVADVTKAWDVVFGNFS